MMGIRIHGSAFRNCGSGSGSGSRLIYEQISYTCCKSKTFNFFLLFYSKKNIRPTPTYWPWGPGSPSRRPPSADCASRSLTSADLSRLLAIFLYPWIRIWIRIKMRIRIQRPKNMRIHADPDPDPDPDPKHWQKQFFIFLSVKCDVAPTSIKKSYLQFL